MPLGAQAAWGLAIALLLLVTTFCNSLRVIRQKKKGVLVPSHAFRFFVTLPEATVGEIR
jgi:hypothetical protein